MHGADGKNREKWGKIGKNAAPRGGKSILIPSEKQHKGTGVKLHIQWTFSRWSWGCLSPVLCCELPAPRCFLGSLECGTALGWPGSHPCAPPEGFSLPFPSLLAGLAAEAPGNSPEPLGDHRNSGEFKARQQSHKPGLELSPGSKAPQNHSCCPA